MPFVKAERLPGEPIVISTYRGFIDADAVNTGAAIIAEHIAAIGDHTFVIADILEITSSFMDVLSIIKGQTHGLPGTATDPNMTLMLVGTSHFAKLYVDILRQQQNGGTQIAMFTQMDEALDIARQRAAQRHKA